MLSVIKLNVVAPSKKMYKVESGKMPLQMFIVGGWINAPTSDVIAYDDRTDKWSYLIFSRKVDLLWR